MKHDKKYTLVPRDIRKEALEAIKKGTNLEAVLRYNAVADEINRESFYEKKVREFILEPYFLIDEVGDVDEKIYDRP